MHESGVHFNYFPLSVLSVKKRSDFHLCRSCLFFVFFSNGIESLNALIFTEVDHAYQCLYKFFGVHVQIN